MTLLRRTDNAQYLAEFWDWLNNSIAKTSGQLSIIYLTEDCMYSGLMHTF